MHNAANEGRLDVMRLLLQRGANKDAYNDTGKTPLHEACSGGQADAAKLLLDAGVSPNVRDLVCARVDLVGRHRKPGVLRD